MPADWPRLPTNASHGDLRSANVLLDDRGKAKVADLGLAKQANKIAASSGTKRGSQAVNWLAPEVLDNSVARSKEADVFSYAMVVFEIAAGEIPFGK